MVVAYALAVAALSQPTPRHAEPVDFEVTCVLANRDGGRDRFDLIAVGHGSVRNFAFRFVGTPRWASLISASSVGDENSFRFVSDGIPYVLRVEFDRPGDALTGNAELDEDRGATALNMQIARGSCRGAARSNVSSLPVLPPAPEVQPVAHETRPMGLSPGSRIPSDCVIILRDLSEVRLALDVLIDAEGIQFAISSAPGQAWPSQPMVLRGALLSARTTPSTGPQAPFMTLLASAGAGTASPAPATLTYTAHAEPNRIEGWVDLRGHVSPEIVGSGFCSVRRSPNEQTGRQQ